MGWLGRPLDRGAPGTGILELEFCWWSDACEALIAGWTSPEVALPGLYGDYLYMVVYSATLSLACLQAGAQLPERWARLGEPVAWLPIVAALCDAVENVALIRLVGGAIGSDAAVAFGCASVKFALLAIGLTYSAAGALSYVRS